MRYQRLRYAGSQCPGELGPEIVVSQDLGQATTHTIEGLLAWSVYNITVEARNEKGNSSIHQTVSICINNIHVLH